MQASQTDSPTIPAIDGDASRRVAREHEAFCRAVSLQLTAQLQAPVELELAGLSQLRWQEALGLIPQPSVYALVDVEPLGTTLLLSAELGAVLRSIARLLGGSDDAEPARPLTEIELVLARHLFATLVAALAETWRELLGIELSLAELETEPEALLVAPPHAPALVVAFELRDGAGASALRLVVPHHAIAPMLEQPVAPLAEPEPEVDVDLRVEVAEVELERDQVLALGPGDVVSLGVPASAGVTVRVDGLALHRGRPGRSGSRRAVQVVGPPGDR
jgi:flagellar motor switch protein FliM